MRVGQDHRGLHPGPEGKTPGPSVGVQMREDRELMALRVERRSQMQGLF